MKVLSVLLTLALVASAGVLSQVMAQMPSAGGKAPAAAGEQSVTGEIQSINPSGKELTLKDGTKLVLKDDAKMQGLKEGATVTAKYKVESGQNVVTSIDVQAPAASPPTTTPAPPAPEKKQ